MTTTALSEPQLRCDCNKIRSYLLDAGYPIDGDAMLTVDAVEDALRIESALASAEPVAWYTEDHLTDKSATTWDKETAKRWTAKGWPVWSLYAHAQPAAKGESLGDGLRDYPYLIGLAKVLRMRGDPENANALDSVAERIRRTAPTPASVPDAVLEVSRRLIREAIPATASGQTCFVPKYVIAQLADAIGFFTTPEPTP